MNTSNFTNVGVICVRINIGVTLYSESGRPKRDKAFDTGRSE